jgi:hypothetical protein
MLFGLHDHVRMKERECQGRRGIPVPEAPQTINEKRTPFLTFFFLRIFICDERALSVANIMAVSLVVD